MSTTYDLTAEEVRALLDAYATDQLGERRLRDAIDAGQSDVAVYREVAGDLGLAEALIPAWAGGLGGGRAVAAAAFERLGAHLAWGPFRATLGHAVPLLREAGEKTPALTLLDRIRRGDAAVVLLDEFDVEDGPTGVQLTGSTRTVLAGADADVFLVAASNNGGVTLLQLEADAPGVVRTRVPCIDPTQTLADIQLDGAAASVVHDDGARAWEDALLEAALLHAASTCGTAGRLLEVAVEHGRTRWQFGRPIGSFQAVKHRCARMLIEHRLATAAVTRAATAPPHRRHIEVAVAIHTVREAACMIGAGALQVLGGIGFTWEHPAHLYFKRLTADRHLGRALGGGAESIARHLEI